MMRDESCYFRVIFRPRFPHRPRPLFDNPDVILSRVAKSHVEDGQKRCFCWWFVVGPHFDSGRETLKQRRYVRRANIFLQCEVESKQVNCERLIRMWSTSMLHGVCIDGELMDLAEQDSITVFSAEHFSVQIPALVTHVVIPARRS